MYYINVGTEGGRVVMIGCLEVVFLGDFLFVFMFCEVVKIFCNEYRFFISVGEENIGIFFLS